jgi:predicted transcriptional regulator
MIFDGEKTVELRRLKPRVRPGDTVLVYISSPVKALAGTFEVSELEEGSPKGMWPTVKDRAGVTKKEFDQYYEGAERAFGIGVQSAKRMEPLPLAHLRKKISNFHPPQSYRYLTTHQMRRLELAEVGTE